MRHPLVLEAHRQASLEAPGADDTAHRVVSALSLAGLEDEQATYAYGALHDFVTPEWYFEIGTNRGGSLEVCPGKFIAVDPQLILTNFSMKDRPEGHFFQITSDGFFDLGFLEGLGIRPELGFLDGMHRFEFLLRDFMNFEKRSAPGAIAILHDCLPFTAAMTARDWDPKKTRQWTGDVWKTLAILLKHRPDLQIDVLDAYPTGLVILRNLDAENTTLAGCYDAVVAEFLDTDIAAFGPATYFDMFQIQSSHAAIAALRTMRPRPIRLIGEPEKTCRNPASSSASRSASAGAASSPRGRKARCRAAVSANLFHGHTARQSSQP